MKKLFFLLSLVGFASCYSYDKLLDGGQPLTANACYLKNGKYVTEYKGQDLSGKTCYIYMATDSPVAIGTQLMRLR